MALALAACQTTGGDRAWKGDSDPQYVPTAAEKQLEQDNQIYNDTILGGAAQGAVTGALLGAVLGLATGDYRYALIGAGAGAVGGGLIGGLDGYMVAKKQEAARKKVREIMLITEDVKKENDNLIRSIANMDVVIEQTRTNLDKARADYEAGTATVADVRRTEDRAERNLASMGDLIDGMESRNKEYEEIARSLKQKGEDTTEIDAQIADARDQIAAKKKERDLLAQDLEQGRIG
jgi:outer membrane lipoprotein SlyB